jgi:hypothetical protein
VRRTARGAGSVARGGVERHGNDDEACILRPGLEAEEPIPGRGGIGVESCGDDRRA